MGWFSDPVAKVLAALVLLSFLPGALIIGATVWLIALVVLLAVLIVSVAASVVVWVGGISPVGVVAAIGLAALFGFIGWRFYQEELAKEVSEQAQNAIALCRRVVEFVAWLRFLGEPLWLPFRGKHQRSQSGPGVPLRNGILSTQTANIMGASMQKSSDDQGLSLIRSQMAGLQLKNPYLPAVPGAFSDSTYRSWFSEAIKRFQLQSYQRTQAERLTVLSQIQALQRQYLAIVEADSAWQKFPQRDRITQKKLDIEEIKVDMELAELKEAQRKQAQPPPPPPPVRRPTDPVQEAISRIRNTVRTIVSVEAEIEALANENPAQEALIRREGRKLIIDMRERH